MSDSREHIALQTLAAAASLYLKTLDDFARPIVSAQLQNSINILTVKINNVKDSESEDNG